MLWGLEQPLPSPPLRRGGESKFMENNFSQNNFGQKSTVWETNPHLRILLLVLIFVFLFCGIGLVLFNQYQAQKISKEYNLQAPVTGTVHKVIPK